MSKKRIDIIGAGVSGLTIAYYLNKLDSDRKLEINVWEKDKDPGGLAGSFNLGDLSVEKFYHHIYRRDLHVQELIKELCFDALVWKGASVGSYFEDKAYSLSSPIDLLRLTPLSFLDRLHFGFMMVALKVIKNWEKLDDISAKEYIEKYAGRNVYKILI